MKNIFKNFSCKSFAGLILIFFVIIVVRNSYSGTGWYLQNSGISNNLNSVHFVNALTGYAVGDSGKIVKTTNGGINWIQQSSPYNISLRKVHFIDANTGWAVGGQEYYNPWCFDYEYVIRTSNGGINWLTSKYSSMGNIHYDVNAIDANSAYISYSGTDMFCMASTGALTKTLNSGANWQIYVGGACRTFHFLNTNTGWAVCMYMNDVVNTNTRKFYMTTNAGANWIMTKRDSFGAFNWNHGSIRFLNGTTGYFNDGFLKKTTNSGYNWTNCDSTYNINSFHFINTNTGWVTGRNNTQIRRTTNGGSNWTLQQSQNTSHLYSVYMVDALTGYAVGANGTVVKTVTGGVTSAVKISSEIPAEYKLGQNYPNPFNSITNIKFSVPLSRGVGGRNVTIKLFDLLGKEVATLVNEKLNPGTYEVKFESGNLPSGIYFYRMESEKFTYSKKMILQK